MEKKVESKGMSNDLMNVNDPEQDFGAAEFLPINVPYGYRGIESGDENANSSHIQEEYDNMQDIWY